MTRANIATTLILSVLCSACSIGPLGGQSPGLRVSVVPTTAGIRVGDVSISGSRHSLPKYRGGGEYSNGNDSYYTTPLADGGLFILYRFAPPVSSIYADPYPELALPGTTVQYAAPSTVSPFVRQETATPPMTFATPFNELKWPALFSNAGIGIFTVAESPIYEEPIEPFVSAYPTVRITAASAARLRIGFDEPGGANSSASLDWTPSERTIDSTTYVASVPTQATSAIVLQLQRPTMARRIWYSSGGAWIPAITEVGGSNDPNLVVVHVKNPTRLLVESVSGPPSGSVTMYTSEVGYVSRARWAAFTIYLRTTASEFFGRSLTPTMRAYNDWLFRLRDPSVAPSFSQSWRQLLDLVAFTEGKNELNPKFFDHGFPAYGDPAYESNPSLQRSVSWVSDESALQAVMGSRLFDFGLDPRYAEGVKAFYDPTSSFYFGAYDRTNQKLTSADTGGSGVVIGYNYLLSITRLTELIDTPAGLPAQTVQSLVDRALPLLETGYVQGYSQVSYLWKYPPLSGLQWEYGMGKELSEAQLSYVCGLWWLRTRETRYLRCETSAIRLPEAYALTLRGSSFLWGLDVVHGSYVMDALILAYKTTASREYLDAALTGWREELLFLFSDLNYPETSFDDRAMTVTSFYSTFADLHQGNDWRGDSWNNVRTLWSLSKVLAYVDDPRIVWELQLANQTHKQSMPLVDTVYSPTQRSGVLNVLIDQNDFGLSYEDLRAHYSTEIAFSNDVWRDAFLFESIDAVGGSVFRIPGTLLTDAGLAYVVGAPHALVSLTIRSRDIAFKGGQKSLQLHLGPTGIARLPLMPTTLGASA